MNKSTLIKLGSVNNLSDARYAAAVGINYIGFNFDPASLGYVPPIKAKEMMDWLTGSNLVAEFGSQSLSEMSDICELLHVDGVEVNNNLTPDELLSLEKPVIKKINISALDFDSLSRELIHFSKIADAFHLFSEPETIKLNESELIEICKTNNIIWGLPITTGSVMEIINTYKPFAIHLVGSDEEKPGVKSFDELNEIVDLVMPQV